MILLLRCLPFCVGLFEIGIFYWQRSHPEWYPWVAVLGVLAVPFASLAITRNRIQPSDMLEKMAPTFALLVMLAFGLLMVETRLALWTLLGVAAFASYISLELLFLLTFRPAAYPVNGLSRVNIAYVPLAAWYAMSTSAGLLIFLHIPRFWHVALAAALGAVLFRTTGHPGATREQHGVWTMIGTVIGIQIGLVGLLLPFSMMMQGFVAACLFSFALRARRYLYEPRPEKSVAIREIVAASVVFISTLLTAKWL